MKAHDLSETVLANAAPWAAVMGVSVFGIVAGGQWWTERAAIQNLPAASTDAPNVVVILVDTLRADHLSALRVFASHESEYRSLGEPGDAFRECSFGGVVEFTFPCVDSDGTISVRTWSGRC